VGGLGAPVGEGADEIEHGGHMMAGDATLGCGQGGVWACPAAETGSRRMVTKA
jgi:hypothetical protein